jgi:large subunit ribosomal protein L10
MHRSEKETAIKELNEKFARATSAILAEFSRLDVATVTNLRKKLRDAGVEYRVIKNTLARRAAKGTSLELVSDEFSGPLALVIGYTDVVAPAKVLSDFIKDRETIKVRGGVVEGKRIDVNGFKALAKLPGLTELRARIVGLINQPAARLARTLGAPGSQLARVLKAREENLGKQG